MIFRLLSRRSKTKPSLAIEFYCSTVALTDVGEMKESNEDRLIFINPHDDQVKLNKGCLALICDGMGGHNSGDYAAQLAIENIPEVYYNSDKSNHEALLSAVMQANALIYKIATTNAKHSRMGTTSTAVIILDEDLSILHAGDSRVYLLDGPSIRQLTKDHTYVEHLYQSGSITKEEKDTHPDRNIVTKVIGTQKELDPDSYSYPKIFKKDMMLLLCTDGLYDYIKDDEILKICSEMEKSIAAQKMIDLAKQRGGHDNISVMIIEKTDHSEIQDIKKTREDLS